MSITILPVGVISFMTPYSGSLDSPICHTDQGKATGIRGEGGGGLLQRHIKVVKDISKYIGDMNRIHVSPCGMGREDLPL